MMNSASIIVPTHNRRAELVETLGSLQAQAWDAGPVEIIVVDNASSDGTPQVVADLSGRGPFVIKYIHEARAGLHHCRHTGARAADGDLLIYVDDDIRADACWLSSLMAAYADPGVECAGGRVLPAWQVEPPGWVRQVSPDYLSLLDYGPEPRELRGREGVNGCNFSVKRRVLFEVGGFNPDGFADPAQYWHRGDGEAGLVAKIQSRGGRVWYVPGALVWHTIPASRLTLDYFRRRASLEGVSRAYAFARRRRCAAWAVGALIAGGALRSGLHRVRGALARPGPAGVGEALTALKFWTAARYGWQLVRDPGLAAHVLRASYME